MILGTCRLSVSLAIDARELATAGDFLRLDKPVSDKRSSHSGVGEVRVLRDLSEPVTGFVELTDDLVATRLITWDPLTEPFEFSYEIALTHMETLPNPNALGSCLPEHLRDNRVSVLVGSRRAIPGATLGLVYTAPSNGTQARTRFSLKRVCPDAGVAHRLGGSPSSGVES
jgi:hypothetical protein